MAGLSTVFKAAAKALAAASAAVVSCEGPSAAKKAAATASPGHPLFLYGAAAASTLALVITAGYHFCIESDEADGGPEGKVKTEEEAGAEAALLQARESLNLEWTQTNELNKASNGTLGFEAW